MSSSGFISSRGQASFNEVLINTVRQYPPLYSNLRRVFDTVDRNRIWEEVAARIGRQVSPEFAKKRWLQLRDRYRKELKIAVSHNFSQPHKWKHFHLLRWLEPFLQRTVSVPGTADPSSDQPLILPPNNMSTNPGLADLAKSLGINAHQNSAEAVDLYESDVLEDTKPTLSTLQSVLAAAEAASANVTANARKKSELFGNDNINETEDSPNLIGCASNSTNIFDIGESASWDHRSQQNCVTNEINEFSRASHCSSQDGGSTDGDPEVESCSPPTPLVTASTKKRTNIATLRDSRITSQRYVPYSNQSRPPQRITPKVTRINEPVPPCTGPSASSSPSDDLWFNDEEMLFARIVGLRLKKMNPVRRKAVRAKVMQILDEEDILQEEGYSLEAGASVAE